MKKFLIVFGIIEILFLLIGVCNSRINKQTNKPLILVSTIDGKISAISIEEKGKIIWSNDFNAQPLVSSSLTKLFYNQV